MYFACRLVVEIGYPGSGLVCHSGVAVQLSLRNGCDGLSSRSACSLGNWFSSALSGKWNKRLHLRLSIVVCRQVVCAPSQAEEPGSKACLDTIEL